METDVIVAIIALGSGAFSTLVGAAVAIVTTVIANKKDNAKREITDIELDFKDLNWYVKIFKDGEYSQYSKKSQERILAHYRKAYDKLLQDVTKKHEVDVTALACGPDDLPDPKDLF